MGSSTTVLRLSERTLESARTLFICLLFLPSCQPTMTPARLPSSSLETNAPQPLANEQESTNARYPGIPREAPYGRSIVRTDFEVALPENYHDATDELNFPHDSAALLANEMSRGYRPSIVVRRIPVAGGSFSDAANCLATGQGLASGVDRGQPWKLLAARIIQGPVGMTCQIHLLAPDGIALITELHRQPNTPKNPKPVWLMTCNHADGDQKAESTCRVTLETFKFRD